MTFNRSRVNRIWFFSAAILIAFACAVVWQAPMQTAESANFQLRGIYDVVPDTSALSLTAPIGTTFYFQGRVYPFRTVNQAECLPLPSSIEPLGSWRAWGQQADGGRLVIHHTFLLDKVNGAVEVQGVTGVLDAGGGVAFAISGANSGPTTGPTEVLSVVGGSGSYSGAAGNAEVRPYCNPSGSAVEPPRPFRYDRPFCVGF